MVTALAVADGPVAVGGEVAPAEGLSTAFVAAAPIALAAAVFAAALIAVTAAVLAAATLRTAKVELTTAA